MPSVSTFLNATLDYFIADRICCHNHIYAESRGYFASDGVDLFSRLDPNATEPTTFYDSVCGIPLFVAPRGRTFDEFRTATEYYGWPSFTSEEIVSENVVVDDSEGGRMESACGTHLGHKLPEDNEDGFYYCVDLVCVAGTPLDDSVVTESDDGTVGTDLWNSEATNTPRDTSSGEQFRSKLFRNRGYTINLILLCFTSWLLLLY